MENVERWAAAPGYESFYEISSLGRVRRTAPSRSTYVGRIRKLQKRNGYLQCEMCKNGASKIVTVHRLVALAFVPNPENKPEVNHKNGVRSDNRVDNLEWVTPSENISHADRVLKKVMGMHGEKSRFAKVTFSQVKEIADLYGRGGVTQEALGRKYGITQSAVSNIVRQRNWRLSFSGRV